MFSKDSTENKHVVNIALCLHHRIGNPKVLKKWEKRQFRWNRFNVSFGCLADKLFQNFSDFGVKFKCQLTTYNLKLNISFQAQGFFLTCNSKFSCTRARALDE